ncbi:MAG: diguanylate cyclase [Acidimicrobiia bacterium]|nr:diguanylate cyclase [Acidimicrobiia bacterium]
MDGSDGSSASDPAATGVVDRVSGLLEQRFLGVLVHQRVAAARRQLQPVSVVLFEVDGLGSADDEVKNQALGVLGEVIRSTLRECDAACRIGDLMAGAVLLDTTEAGAMWAAERVRGNLLASPVGSELTISAGIACYPTHALGAAELVEMAGRALERAREQGYDRVEIAPTD